MKYRLFFVTLSLLLTVRISFAEDYLLSSAGTSLVISADKGGGIPKFKYYGCRISPEELPGLQNSRSAFFQETYPVFGIRSIGEKAFSVTQADGSMSIDLKISNLARRNSPEGEILEIVMQDKVYPLQVTQYYKVYKDSDVISSWVEITNNGRKTVTMHKFASAVLPLKRDRNWISHLHGRWGSEQMLVEEPLTNGQKVISNMEGISNSATDNPSFMISMDGRPEEEHGRVIGGVLAWSGNYKMKFITTNNELTVIAGINEDNSFYFLEAGKTFTTPEFAMTYSSEGKGGVSRAFHSWARKYKLCHGDVPRDILLNSWEGVYLNVDHDKMIQMMKDISSMGGELFVMDDGWFGDKYPRDIANSSLGDWVVCRRKLPQGVEGLVKGAEKNGIKFGIWIEPEMANTISELYEKHPDWVLKQANRPLTKGRGGTQVVLDMTNPAVQDHVFNVVDRLKTENPKLAYIKWDANFGLQNYGSTYLPADRQSHIYIEYHKGLNKVLERIRNKYPDMVIQACASGGGRVNYGLLPYFDEFWTSDNTDAMQRIYMQWGVSSFYPAIAMASHVSATKNHQTGRIVPLKFRFDVAMSGRLGMEMQPQDMSAEERAFSARCIAAYKKIRPVVQFGDLFRLISPYERRGLASLMYASPEKRQGGCVHL